MAEIEWEQLQSDAEALLERVTSGETLTITIDGRPVASLGPIGGRPRFMDRDRFVAYVMSHQADSSFMTDLRSLELD